MTRHKPRAGVITIERFGQVSQVWTVRVNGLLHSWHDRKSQAEDAADLLRAQDRAKGGAA